MCPGSAVLSFIFDAELTNYQNYYKTALFISLDFNIQNYQSSKKMGNTQQQFQQTNINWLKQYEIIEQNLHDNIMLIQSLKTGEEYYGKVLKCSKSEVGERIDRVINLKLTFENKYISKIIHWDKKNADSFCSTNVEYSFVFEKGAFSLKDETYNRKFKFQQFHQAQIMLILESVMKGLLFLQQINEKHRRICSENIFIREDRSIFLSDPWLYSSKATSIFKMNETGYNYPSPEKILFQNDLIDSYDEHLSDYYSLGIVLLELINMEPMDFIYEKGFRRVLDKKIVEEISKIKRSDLKERIQILVNHYPHKRKEIERFYQKPTRTQSFVKKEIQQFKQKIQISNRQKINHENNINNINIAPPQTKPMNQIHYPSERTQWNSAVATNSKENNRAIINNATGKRPKIVFTHFGKELRSNLAWQTSMNKQKSEPVSYSNEEQRKIEVKLDDNQLTNQDNNKNPLLKLYSIQQQLPSQSRNSQSNFLNSLDLQQVKSSIDDSLQNNDLKLNKFKKTNQLNTLMMKEAQSINASDEKSQVVSEVIGHGFSAKSSMINGNSKRLSMDEVRKSVPEQPFEELPEAKPKITNTISLPSEKAMSQDEQSKVQKMTKMQSNIVTPDRRPLKKRNHSTIKQVSQESPSVVSRSQQYEENYFV